jgi:hypothetical protein
LASRSVRLLELGMAGNSRDDSPDCPDSRDRQALTPGGIVVSMKTESAGSDDSAPSRLSTRVGGNKTDFMEFKQSTFENLIEGEQLMLLNADQRYGKYYTHARECSVFLSL